MKEWVFRFQFDGFNRDGTPRVKRLHGYYDGETFQYLVGECEFWCEADEVFSSPEDAVLDEMQDAKEELREAQKVANNARNRLERVRNVVTCTPTIVTP